VAELVPDVDLWEKLSALKKAQEPLGPGMPRHPSKKVAYFNALAEAFEEGCLLPVREQT
jgi:hypothetical protein